MAELLFIYLPVATAFVACILFLWLLHWLLLGRHERLGAHARLPRQLLMFLFSTLALLLLIILFPMSDSTRGQVITLMGLVITGVIALSSTTFVANVMAGLMLHVVKSFHTGDFIRVGTQFGRVTERGLFHTEIQTEDRDLSTIPNLHLVTNPVTVVHSTGTIISAELSLGYDLSRIQVEELLKQAALRTELQEPFVLVTSLGDFSVVYRICGFLAEVKNLITVRSTLKKNMLDVLHEHNVEIVSPSFMNQRQLGSGRKIIPQADHREATKTSIEESLPEELIFDKAEMAAETELTGAKIDGLELQLEQLAKSRKNLDQQQLAKIDREIDIIEKQKQQLITALEEVTASEALDK